MHQLKRHVKERVSEYFTRVCRSNNFLGRINIDLEKERIDMLVVPCQGNASPDEVEQARNKVSSTRIFFTLTQLSFSLTLLLGNQKIMFVNWVAAREASRLLHFCWLFGSVSNPRYDVWMNSRCLWTKIRKAEQLLCFVNMLQNIQKPRFEKSQIVAPNSLPDQFLSTVQFVFLTPTGLSESKEALGKGFGNIFKYQSLQKPIRGRQPNNWSNRTI